LYSFRFVKVTASRSWVIDHLIRVELTLEQNYRPPSHDSHIAIVALDFAPPRLTNAPLQHYDLKEVYAYRCEGEEADVVKAVSHAFRYGTEVARDDYKVKIGWQATRKFQEIIGRDARDNFWLIQRAELSACLVKDANHLEVTISFTYGVQDDESVGSVKLTFERGTNGAQQTWKCCDQKLTYGGWFGENLTKRFREVYQDWSVVPKTN
jgi:hypothetical protein